MSERRVAIVTGGAKRVGAAIVRKLSASGFDVVFTYHRSGGDAERLQSECGATGVQADLSEPSNVPSVFDSLTLEHARLDLLVNNASLFESDVANESSLETLSRSRRLMALHFETPLLLSRLCEPLLRKSAGHIVNMVDLIVEHPRPGFATYGASKAALWNLTLSLAREISPQVTVNGIAPGVVEWPSDFPEDQRRKYLARVPLAREGTPQDVAELVCFLATTGSYITGQIIRMDGGRSIT